MLPLSRRRLFMAAAALILSACVTPPPPVNEQSHENWQQRIDALSLLSHWQLSGRVAVFANDDVYNLGLRWNRDGDISDMSFEASLGQGLVKLQKDQQGVTLTTHEGKVIRGSNPQQVINQATGLTIPVAGLESWIKGIPRPNMPYEHDIDGLGRAKHINQDGWFINYLDYEAATLAKQGPVDLPRKLYMKRDTLALKIVLDQWQSDTPPVNQDLFPDFPVR